MASFFKRRNLLGRRTCSYFLVLLALASIALFYVIKEHATHRQSRSRLVPDIDLHSDTNLHIHSIMQEHSSTLRLDGDLKANTSGRHDSIPTYRFLLGLNYWEQLTMATLNMFQLVCLADSWNSSVVQPFTLDSRLYGLRNFKAGKLIIFKDVIKLCGRNRLRVVTN